MFHCISSDFSDLPDMTDEYIELTAGVRITTGPRARGPKNGGGAPRFSG